MTMLLRRPAICVALMLALPLAACSKKEAPYAVAEVPLAQVSADLAAGKTTSVAVTRAYIERIKLYDAPLHAVILIAPDAEQQAAASDKRRKEGKALGPLDGVPILIKDNIDAVGMATTAGSYALANNKPAQDSEVAKRLKAAGAIILGKANLSQWAAWRATTAFNGSTVGGGVHNPYDVTKSAAGSSSGSGAAAAASFSAATVGTETSGSVTGPSNVNGVVGMKPTIALVSRRGIEPISHNQDTAGPMARSVMDAAMLLNAMAGSDPGDPASADADAHKTDYVKALDPNALKGVRLGVVRGLRGYNEKTNPVFDAAMEVLKAQGAELVDIDGPAVFEDLTPEMRTILLYDFKQDVNAYLATTSPDMVKSRTLTDLIAFNNTEEHEKLHTQENFVLSDETKGFDEQEYKDTLASAKAKAGVNGIDKVLADNNVSALVNLTGGPANTIVPDGTATGGPVADRPKGQSGSMTVTAAIAGYPHLTVPMGLVEGMPVGLSFIGTAWTEGKLLAYGYAYEQASHARVAPKVPAAPAAAQ
jgi:amidase